MPNIHIVEEREHVSAVAERFGFHNWRTVWDHPNNDALRELRAYHHIVHPGDELFVPDFQEKIEDGATTQTHVFVVENRPLFLRLRLQDWDARPLVDVPCGVGLDTLEVDAVTDGEGMIDQPVGKQVKDGEVRAHRPEKSTLKYDLHIGGLRDERTFLGQQARLNNMGYFAGFSKTDEEQFWWAAEEFLCDTDKKPVTRGPFIDPELGVVDATGAPDAAFVAKLVKAHGI